MSWFLWPLIHSQANTTYTYNRNKKLLQFTVHNIPIKPSRCEFCKRGTRDKADAGNRNWELGIGNWSRSSTNRNIFAECREPRRQLTLTDGSEKRQPTTFSQKAARSDEWRTTTTSVKRQKKHLLLTFKTKMKSQGDEKDNDWHFLQSLHIGYRF